MDFFRLDDLANLRVNPSLKRRSEVDSDETRTCAIFRGNASSVVPVVGGAREVPFASLENVVALREGDVVIASQRVAGGFPVYQVEAAELPVYLAPQQTKVIPTEPEANLAFLHWTISRSLFRKWQGIGTPPKELPLRIIRDLELYWPDANTQEAIVEEHRRLHQRLRAAHEAMLSQRELYRPGGPILAFSDLDA